MCVCVVRVHVVCCENNGCGTHQRLVLFRDRVAKVGFVGCPVGAQHIVHIPRKGHALWSRVGGGGCGCLPRFEGCGRCRRALLDRCLITRRQCVFVQRAAGAAHANVSMSAAGTVVRCTGWVVLRAVGVYRVVCVCLFDTVLSRTAVLEESGLSLF